MENKKLTFENLSDDEKKFMLALRDPVIGPKLKAYIRSTDTYKAMFLLAPGENRHSEPGGNRQT